MSANKPVLTLNMDEKIYLAVAKQDLDKLSFVYTLACLRRGPNQYDVNPVSEIHTFKSHTEANVYHDTINQIVDFHANDKTKKVLFDTNSALIESFLENTR